MNNREEKGKSIIEFPEEYICIDIETTGLSCEYDNIIEIAAIRVKQGKMVETFSSLIQPPINCYGNFIGSFIEELTGITNEMLETAPKPEEVFPKFFDFIGNHILVGHNIVRFDANFTYDACLAYGLTLKNNLIDTMRIARKLLPQLEHHGLADLIEYFSISQNVAHRAEADVIATIECYEKMKSKILETETFSSFQERFIRKNFGYNNIIKSLEITVDDIDDTNPIFGKTVVFTGALSTMERKEAFQIVKNLGGNPEDTITKKTNFLVLSRETIQNIRKDESLKSNKIKTAEEYQKKGRDVTIISEDTFLKMINY